VRVHATLLCIVLILSSDDVFEERIAKLRFQFIYIIEFSMTNIWDIYECLPLRSSLYQFKQRNKVEFRARKKKSVDLWSRVAASDFLSRSLH
jgi:hypothetical protein